MSNSDNDKYRRSQIPKQGIEQAAGANIRDNQCQAFLLCKNPATTTFPHPILGKVYSCERCKAKLS